MPPTPPITLESRRDDAHKGSFGRAMLIGGSRGMAGSIALSSIAALHAGSGLVSTVVPDRALETVASFHPSLMTIPLPCCQSGKRDEPIGHAIECHGTFAEAAWDALRTSIENQNAIGMGPGMTTCVGSTNIVKGLLKHRTQPLVLDADALNIVSVNDWFADATFAPRDGQPDLVITPHRGELARLTGVPASQHDHQNQAAKQLAVAMNTTVVVKGGPSLVLSPFDAPDYINTTGNSGMATAGSGDVLTGIITSLLGQGLSGWNAARLGVWIHGLAGDTAVQQKSRTGMTSWHLVESLAEVADRMQA